MSSQEVRRLHRWSETHVMVIDEISMCGGELFDKLDQIAQRTRNNPKRFGGLQVICCGDFCQLPSVGDKRSKKGRKWCFESRAWSTLRPRIYDLKTIMRQRDRQFIAKYDLDAAVSDPRNYFSLDVCRQAPP